MFRDVKLLAFRTIWSSGNRELYMMCRWGTTVMHANRMSFPCRGECGSVGLLADVSRHMSTTTRAVLKQANRASWSGPGLGCLAN